MTDLAKLVVKLEAQTAQYQAGLEKANKQLSKFNRSASATAANIGKGLAAAAVAGAAALGYMAKSAIDNQDRLSKLSQSIGVSTEALSQLEWAADISGTSSEVLTKALGKLSKAAFTAARDGGIAAQSFEQLGVKVQNADGTMRPTEDLLLDIADKFAGMENGAAKTALAMEIFGKAGAQLIPFLNQGREGISALTAEADRLGVTLDSEAGRAAEQFNDNLTRLKTAGAGMVNQATQEILPMLVAMSERFVKASQSGGTLSAGVSLLVGVFKTLVSSGIIVTSVFQQLGRIIYGVGAAVVRVAQGEFRLAKQEITDAFAEARSNVTDDLETIAAVWADTVPEVASSAKAMDEVLEDTVVFSPNKAGDLAQKAADAAVESLRSMAQGLEQEIATLEMTESATIRYRLAQGDLSDELAAGGPAAQEYADKIIALTDEMAALAAETEAAKQVQTDWAAVQDRGKSITEAVRTPLEQYQEKIRELNEALELGVITNETYNRSVENAQEAFESAEEAGTTFMEQASRNVQDILAGSLDDLVADFGKMLAQMAAQAVAADIAGKLFGSGGVGSGGGWLGQLGGAAMSFIGGLGGGGLSPINITAQRIPMPTGGGMASGGPVHAGRAYRVGDQNRAEWFVPERSGRIEPERAAGAMTVNQQFSVAAPNGTVSRKTEQQIAAAAARGLATANRRNN